MVMNLRAVSNSVTRVVNPNFPATLFISTPPTIVNFVQTPQYDKASIIAQVQPLSSGDIRMLDALNIQGAQKSIYLNGPALAISRIKKLGGDLIVFADGIIPEGNTWLVLAQIEIYGAGGIWSRVACSLQDDIPDPS